MSPSENVLGIMEVNCPDGINTEDYNQIDPHILACFPLRQYPINLFKWKEEIRTLSPIYSAGKEVDAKFRDAAHKLSEKGLLFFSRNQIIEYTNYAAYNIEAALDDPNLSWDELAGLFVRKLSHCQTTLFASPLPYQFNDLKGVVEILAKLLLEDRHRLTNLVKEVHKHLTQERRHINSSIIALAIYMELNKDTLQINKLTNSALGFLLYDIGMSRLSPFMLAKPQQLTPPEKRIMREHPTYGLQVLEKLGIADQEIEETVMQHHERLNGTGYPNKLKGDAISQLGRITGVADSYCAMITPSAHRAHKPPINAAADLVTNERRYDQNICRTLVKFLQTVQK